MMYRYTRFAELELMQLILAAMTPTMRLNFGNEHV